MEADERTLAQRALADSARLPTEVLFTTLQALHTNVEQGKALFHALRRPMNVSGQQLPRELRFAYEQLWHAHQIFERELHLATRGRDAKGRPQ